MLEADTGIMWGVHIPHRAYTHGMQTALPLDGKAGPGALVLRVSEVSGIIVDALDIQALQDFWVQGEVSNFRPHPSGHHYFSLSETVGSRGYLVNCVMWRSAACRLDFEPKNGMAVVVSGSVQVYEPQGKYQIVVREMKKAGEGEKHLLVERWKRELAAEGLFEPARKREIPRYPARVGVVTAASGAAFQDICTVIGRRYPVEIVLSPTAVQGDGAHVEIAAALARLAGMVDVIIVGRGGGSFEDLFPFNHPDVVRAIAASPVPVVSAVGHDVDWVLADLAADRRAPTPSAAAELVVPDRAEMAKEIGSLRDRMGTGLVKRVIHSREVLEELRQRVHPARLERRLNELRQRVADRDEMLRKAVRYRLEAARSVCAQARSALEGRSPHLLLARGYCMVEKGGRPVRSAREILAGDRLRLRMKDGGGQVKVEEVYHDTEV